MLRSSLLLALLGGCPAEEPPAPADEGMVELSTADGWRFSIDRYEHPNQAGVKPVTYVDMAQAQQACAAESKRLCTAAEWRRACAGPEGSLRFGYGASFRPEACHTGQRLPSGHNSMMDPDALVAPSGAYPGCVTPEGVHDLVGNLEEWVLDDWQGLNGMLEGGAWYTFTSYADCSGRYSRQPDFRVDPEHKVFSAGIRCCRSDEPPPPALIRADAERQQAATQGSPGVPYDPDAEVEVAPGLRMDRYEYPNRPGELPLTGLSAREAQGRCEQAGKRLCEAWEWEQTCAGPEHRALPYGEHPEPGACPSALDQPTASGSHPRCVTGSGVADLVGGVWEWTASPLDIPVKQGSTHGELREIRGGSWFSDPMKSSCYPRNGYPAVPEDQRWPDVGFRCCRGEAPRAQDQPQPASVRCPEGMTPIGDFCIDTWEHPSRLGEQPAAQLSLDDARQACSERGVRLCTVKEWEQACSGQHRRRWPYGNTYIPERCNDDANRDRRQGAGASPAGAFPDCVTPEGVADMSGNLWEWVEDDSEAGGGRMQGGGWNLSSGLGQCWDSAEAQPGHRSPQTGTRCCSDGR
jgi:formylglycine-generating enzyme required for sulfatase activity